LKYEVLNNPAFLGMVNISELLQKSEIFLSLAGAPRDYMREYMRNRYHSVRQKVIKELGGKCTRCGSKKDLHLDHIDRKKKSLRMADIHSVSDARLKKELKNIQILCKKCHNEKSHEAWDFSTPKPKHGTYWMYRRHGCRCKPCSTAYREKKKEWRNKNAEATSLRIELETLRQELADAAQSIYNVWNQQDGIDQVLGEHGIAPEIASAIADVISDKIKDIDFRTMSGEAESQDSWVAVWRGPEAFEISIPYSVYQIGSGDKWIKIPDVRFTAGDVLITISEQPDF